MSVERPIPEEDPLVEAATRAYFDEYDREDLCRQLRAGGYGALATVEDVGERMARVIAAVREDIERAAREDERERCARIADDMQAEDGPDCYYDGASPRCVAARLREGGRDE